MALSTALLAIVAAFLLGLAVGAAGVLWWAIQEGAREEQRRED